MNIVYVVTSDGNDLFSSMTRVSIASVRYSMPDARVVVVCDMDTGVALTHASSPLLKEADHIETVFTPPGPPGYRNRHVKTRLRLLLDDNFLFLDSDTLVRGDLTRLFPLNADVAAARNHSAEALADQIWTQDLHVLRCMKWPVPAVTYVNGGLLAYSDSNLAYEFAEKWHSMWRESWVAMNSHRDQPALNAALVASGATVQVLSDQYNLQLRKANRSLAKAVVWHYYSSDSSPATTAFDLAVRDVMTTGKVNDALVREMVDRPHPWRREYWFDDMYAWLVTDKSRLNECDMLWLTGHRFKSVKGRLKRLFFRRSWLR